MYWTMQGETTPRAVPVPNSYLRKHDVPYEQHQFKSLDIFGTDFKQVVDTGAPFRSPDSVVGQIEKDLNEQLGLLPKKAFFGDRAYTLEWLQNLNIGIQRGRFTFDEIIHHVPESISFKFLVIHKKDKIFHTDNMWMACVDNMITPAMMPKYGNKELLQYVVKVVCANPALIKEKFPDGIKATDDIYAVTMPCVEGDTAIDLTESDSSEDSETEDDDSQPSDANDDGQPDIVVESSVATLKENADHNKGKKAPKQLGRDDTVSLLIAMPFTGKEKERKIPREDTFLDGVKIISRHARVNFATASQALLVNKNNIIKAIKWLNKQCPGYWSLDEPFIDVVVKETTVKRANAIKSLVVNQGSITKCIRALNEMLPGVDVKGGLDPCRQAKRQREKNGAADEIEAAAGNKESNMDCDGFNTKVEDVNVGIQNVTIDQADDTTPEIRHRHPAQSMKSYIKQKWVDQASMDVDDTMPPKEPRVETYV